MINNDTSKNDHDVPSLCKMQSDATSDDSMILEVVLVRIFSSLHRKVSSYYYCKKDNNDEDKM